jgi:hypothetical protein
VQANLQTMQALNDYIWNMGGVFAELSIPRLPDDIARRIQFA